ncbi:discoidin domain-containing protein [Roseovarius aestuariivivens]|uniref:discoidin domain-containing protein n=1 Tax=Roseovarius aestuariivivens TaxID=1888910 RepID=UPI001080DD47|nr:discoidin domain-containing protein [Roseovarius aestuariivivens]
MKRKFSVLKNGILASALVLAATASQAATIVGANSATASSTFGPGNDISNAIDQTGLSSTYISGVTDFDAYLATNPTHNTLNTTEWFTATPVSSATLVFDLGSVLSLDRLALWHEDGAGFTSALLSSSTDGVNFSSLGSISPLASPANIDYGAQVFGFGSVTSLQFFRMELSGCPQAGGLSFSGCGLGEIAFSRVAAIPVPGAGLMLLTGLGIGAAVGRRRRRSA